MVMLRMIIRKSAKRTEAIKKIALLIFKIKRAIFSFIRVVISCSQPDDSRE